MIEEDVGGMLVELHRISPLLAFGVVVLVVWLVLKRSGLIPDKVQDQSEGETHRELRNLWAEISDLKAQVSYLRGKLDGK